NRGADLDSRLEPGGAGARRASEAHAGPLPPRQRGAVQLVRADRGHRRDPGASEQGDPRRPRRCDRGNAPAFLFSARQPSREGARRLNASVEDRARGLPENAVPAMTADGRQNLLQTTRTGRPLAPSARPARVDRDSHGERRRRDAESRRAARAEDPRGVDLRIYEIVIVDNGVRSRRRWRKATAAARCYAWRSSIASS